MKAISLLLFILVVPSTVLSLSRRQKAVTSRLDPICENVPNFVRIAYQESCLKYYQCYSGEAYVMQCPEYTWFNEDEQICDEREPPVGCDPTPEVQPPPVESPDEEGSDSEDAAAPPESETNDNGNGEIPEAPELLPEEDQEDVEHSGDPDFGLEHDAAFEGSGDSELLEDIQHVDVLQLEFLEELSDYLNESPMIPLPEIIVSDDLPDDINFERLFL